MVKTLPAILAVLCLLASSTQARTLQIKLRADRETPISWSCPAGQTITLVDQTGQHDLSYVKRALVAQSLQLRAAWGTPCVRFGSAGWKVYLKGGGGLPNGEHFCAGQEPYALVYVAGTKPEGFSSVLSHELVEMLVDPCAREYTIGQTSYQLEVADPVDAVTYRLDGVNVADFVLPDWYTRALAGDPCSTTTTGGVTCVGPLLASSDTAPWDQAHALRGPWQTLSTS